MKNFYRLFLASFLGCVICSTYAASIESSMHKVEQVIDDSTITTSIKLKYTKSDMLSPFDVHVKTKNGAVNLSGTVDTKDQYEEAVILASRADGVNDVNTDDLKVKASNSPMADTVVTAKVKGVLLKEKLFNDDVKSWPIRVETKDGVVHLSGNVKSDDERDNIIRIAKSIKGVVEVKDELSIKSS